MRVRPYPPIESVILAWFCDGCDEPIENGGGWIEVSYRELRAAQMQDQRVRANLWAKDLAGTPITPGDLADLPDPVRWSAWHQGCIGDQVQAYRMPIGRIRTLAQLIELHGEIASKTWHSLTDFCDLRIFLGSPIVVDSQGIVSVTA